MKALLIILLLPSVASAFFTGVPYNNSVACQRIKADFDKTTEQVKFKTAHDDFSKAYADWERDSANFSNATTLQSFVNTSKKVNSSGISKVMADIAKAFKDALKHQCFRQSGKDETVSCTPGWSNNCFTNTVACINDIKDITKAITRASDKFSWLCASCVISETATKWSNANSSIETIFNKMKVSCKFPVMARLYNVPLKKLYCHNFFKL